MVGARGSKRGHRVTTGGRYPPTPSSSAGCIKPLSVQTDACCIVGSCPFYKCYEAQILRSFYVESELQMSKKQVASFLVCVCK